MPHLVDRDDDLLRGDGGIGEFARFVANPVQDGDVADAENAPDMVLHTAQVTGVLPDLIKIVDGDPRRVMSFSDFDQEGLGVSTTGRELGIALRYDALGQFVQLAAQGRFAVPVARTFGLEDWREALDLSLNRRAHGKLVLLLDRAASAN